MRLVTLTMVICWIPAAEAHAQHDHVHSPYADVETAEGTTLTPEELARLRTGDGMRMALPAELSHYPGPRHVLELADPLGLGAAQSARIRDIYEAMRSEAVAIGERIIDVERHLTDAFRSSEVTADQVERLSRDWGSLRGELRAVHLLAHLATEAVLTDEQIAAYDRLRGYAASARIEPGSEPLEW